MKGLVEARNFVTRLKGELMMKAIIYAPLVLALLVGLAVALLSQPTQLFWAIGVFACATMIAFGMLSCIWFIGMLFVGGLENE